MDNCCVKYGLKYPFVIVGFIFSILGVAILTCGIVMHVSYSNGAIFANFGFLTAPSFLILIGSIIFIISFLGCWGALDESHCKVMTFSIVLLILLLLEVAGGIAGYSMRNELGAEVQKNMNNSMADYKNNKDTQKTWDLMQHELQCCGVNGPNDWGILGEDIPASCCKEIPLDNANNPGKCSPSEANKDGCYLILIDALQHMSKVLSWLAIGVAGFQLVVILFACCLARSIRRDYQTV